MFICAATSLSYSQYIVKVALQGSLKMTEKLKENCCFLRIGKIKFLLSKKMATINGKV